MSQAEFGDSSSQESINPSISQPQYQSQPASSNVIGEPTTLFNSLPRLVLEQELHFCNERSQQAQVLLRQAQEQLQLSQLVIQRQETLTQTLQSRIDQLECDLQNVHTNSHELRDRLKRQQHHTSQLKAALERCLDTSTPSQDVTPKNLAVSALESWSIAKLADEKITPVAANSSLQNVVKIIPTPHSVDQYSVDQYSVDQSVEMPEVQGPDQNLNNLSEPKNNYEVQQSEVSEIVDAPAQLSLTAKQPISPLIVRPHKASQGSPIAFDLPKTARNPNLDSQIEAPAQSIAESLIERSPIAISSPVINNTNDAFVSSSSALANSAIISTVIAPKFIQDLYANVSGATNQQNQERQEETPQLAIASHRRAVTSLAAVQLPQFPPLPRR